MACNKVLRFATVTLKWKTCIDTI